MTVLRERFGLGMLVSLLCGAFAIKAILLVDATSLWCDELYSVGKSFQPSFIRLLEMLRNDTHPPLYYGVLWIWGQIVGHNAVTLRLLSWLFYLLGGGIVVAQAGALAKRFDVSRFRALSLAAVLVFCSPYPIRFAIEGKSYSLLVLLVGLAWWWRRRVLKLEDASKASSLDGVLYGVSVCLASITHYYGLFLFASAVAWDLFRHRWRLGAIAALALLPSLAWIGYASAYLFRDSTAGWLGSPDFALFEETLARALGPWPFPKIGFLLLLILALKVLQKRGDLFARLHEVIQSGDAGSGRLSDQSGLIPSALMVIFVVVISYLKPLAFSRYFVVLVPAVIPWFVVQCARFRIERIGRLLILLWLTAFLVLWWSQSYLEHDPRLGRDGVKEQDNFRAISQTLAHTQERYSPRARLLNLSDRMEFAAGRVPEISSHWGDKSDLRQRLATEPLPHSLWLASSGPEKSMFPRLEPLKKLAEDRRYVCEQHDQKQSNILLMSCSLTVSKGSLP